MERKLTFLIEDNPLPALWQEWDECRCLLHRIELSDEDPRRKSDQFDALWDEMVMLNIAIFCQHYKADSLDAFLRDGLSGRGARDLCRDEIEELRMSSTICGVLADLDVPKIEGSSELKILYHRMRVEVDRARAAGKFFFYDPFFWDMYFRFYYAYNGSE